MALIPISNPIEVAMESGVTYSLPREYIGYSSLGGECKRAIWYEFRWCFMKEIPERLRRIFERGNLEEPRLNRDLEAAGMIVTDDQLEMVGLAGHVKGHIDGKVVNVPGAEKTDHLLESKTAKASTWKKFKKDGVKKTNYVYYCQMQSYMGKLGLTRALFVVTNKDTEERYFERVNFDKEVFDDLERVAFAILTAEKPPAKIGEKTWFVCKMCNSRKVCHGGEDVLKTCRTCYHVDILDDGIWRCDLAGENLDKESQKEGCEKYERLECLN